MTSFIVGEKYFCADLDRRTKEYIFRKSMTWGVIVSRTTNSVNIEMKSFGGSRKFKIHIDEEGNEYIFITSGGYYERIGKISSITTLHTINDEINILINHHNIKINNMLSVIAEAAQH